MYVLEKLIEVVDIFRTYEDDGTNDGYLTREEIMATEGDWDWDRWDEAWFDDLDQNDDGAISIYGE